jgi:hypothetical protein
VLVHIVIDITSELGIVCPWPSGKANGKGWCSLHCAKMMAANYHDATQYPLDGRKW